MYYMIHPDLPDEIIIQSLKMSSYFFIFAILFLHMIELVHFNAYPFMNHCNFKIMQKIDLLTIFKNL